MNRIRYEIKGFLIDIFGLEQQLILWTLFDPLSNMDN